MSTALFLAVLASACLHATWNIAAKRRGGNVGVLWSGQILAAFLIMPFALWISDGALLPPTAAGRGFIVLTGLIQGLYIFLLSRAYKHGDISVVYPIARGCGVVCTAVLAAAAVGEHLSTIGCLGIGCVCVGSIALGLGGKPPRGARSPDAASPAPDQGARTALRYAVAVGVVLAAGAFSDKCAVGTVHPVVYLFWMYLLAGLTSAPLVLTRSRPLVRAAFQEGLPTTILVSVGSLGSYLIILYAFRTGPLAYIAALRETSVLLGALWGFFAFGERYTASKGLGLACITGGLLLIKLA